MNDLERRVAELEAYRRVASGRINAMQQMLLSLLVNGLINTPNARDTVSKLRATWSATIDGTDEYEKAVSDLCARLDEMLIKNERRKN